MPDDKPTPKPGVPAPKRRNPVELFLVRGFIVVMLILVGIEANSWWQHKQAFAALSAKVKSVDDEPNSPAVTESDIKAYFGSKQPERKPGSGPNGPAGAGSYDVYSWFTMSPVNKREIYVYYGKGGQDKSESLEVLLVQGDDKPPPPEPPPAEVAAGTPSVTPPGGGAGMMMGPPGGPGRPGAPGGHSGPGGRPTGASTGADSTDKPEGDESDAKGAKDSNSTGDKPDDADAEKDPK